MTKRSYVKWIRELFAKIRKRLTYCQPFSYLKIVYKQTDKSE